MQLVDGPALLVALRRILTPVLFIVLPIALVALVVEGALGEGTFALDFHHAFWPAGRAVLDGDFAYDPESSIPFAYPPLTAVLFAPFGAIPRAFSEAVYTAVGITGLLLAVRAFGVRDWRCYGLVLLWPPVLGAIQAGNLTLLLVAGVGIAWTVRNRPGVLGLTVAVLISAKLFLWPLLLWLLFTGRVRASAWTVASFTALNAAAWLAIGAGSVADYVDLLRQISGQAHDTYTLRALLYELGMPWALGTAVTATIVVGLAFVLWSWRPDERRALALAVLIALVAAPIVWLHYFALLAVPIALLWPSLSIQWMLPVPLILCPGDANGSTAQTAIGLVVLGMVMLALVRYVGPPGGRSPNPDPRRDHSGGRTVADRDGSLLRRTRVARAGPPP